MVSLSFSNACALVANWQCSLMAHTHPLGIVMGRRSDEPCSLTLFDDRTNCDAMTMASLIIITQCRSAEMLHMCRSDGVCM
jgi:hypothetical protein